MTAKSAQRLKPLPLPGAEGLAAFAELYDSITDTTFFVKDAEGRYLAVNQTLADRVGGGDKAKLLGQAPTALFHGPMAARIRRQDEDVLKQGRIISAALELHVYPGGHEGWCLTWKHPIRNPAGAITGLVGLSRDVGGAATVAAHGPLARALDHVESNLSGPLRVPELAQRAGLSPFQFDKRLRQLFGLSARQYIIRARISAACGFLRGANQPISAVAQACGYSDQAAFTRQFRKSVGLTPAEYRKRQA